MHRGYPAGTREPEGEGFLSGFPPAATPHVTADLEAALPADGVLAKLRDEIGDGLGYQSFPAWFADWPGLEANAARLRSYQLAVVPGLLQTEDYARGLPYAVWRHRRRD